MSTGPVPIPPETDGLPYGRKFIGKTGVISMTVYLILTSALMFYLIVKVWPRCTPSGTRPKPQSSTEIQDQKMNSAPVGGSAAGAPNPSDKPESCPDPTQPVQISLFGDLWKPFLWGEVRLLMIVVLAGAFGSLVHSLRSFYWYVGNRDLKWSWAVMYLLQPFSGGILAMLFYFVIRGGFFSPQSTVDETSPFAFAAFSGLVGMFSPQAVEKLKQIAGTIFAPDQPGKDHLGPSPKIVSVTPASGPKSGNTTITITGTNFTSGAKVSIGGKPVEPTSVNSTTITAATPGTDNAGLVDVEVTNPDGQKTALSGGFNYT